MPGIRENGGQYTHAALLGRARDWPSSAAATGRRALLEMLDPGASHARRAAQVARLPGRAVRRRRRRLRRAAARRPRRLDLVHGLLRLDVSRRVESILGLTLQGGARCAAALRPGRVARLPHRLAGRRDRGAERERPHRGGRRVHGRRRAGALVEGAARIPLRPDGAAQRVLVELGSAR